MTDGRTSEGKKKSRNNTYFEINLLGFLLITSRYHLTYSEYVKMNTFMEYIHFIIMITFDDNVADTIQESFSTEFLIKLMKQ